MGRMPTRSCTRSIDLTQVARQKVSLLETGATLFMVLEALVWSRGSGSDKRVANIAIRGSNVSGQDYDPVHQEVWDIEDQRHDGERRVLDTATGVLRDRTAQEVAAEPGEIAQDGSLVSR